jgi:hypothetical protein
MGHLIPAGTGLKKYKGIILTAEELEIVPEKPELEIAQETI